MGMKPRMWLKHGRLEYVSLSNALTILSSIRAMASIAMKKSNKKTHCQHEYPDNAWKCGKCGYQLLPDLLGKIAETGSGRIMSTTV
jgi:ribosomal protein L40E